MSHAVIDANGSIRQLDAAPEPEDQVTQYEVSSTEKLARRLGDAVKAIAKLMRVWRPDIIDHRDVEMAGDSVTVYRFPHGFGGRVNWWTIRYTGGLIAALSEDPSSDENTLCLVSHEPGTFTIRIERAG